MPSKSPRSQYEIAPGDVTADAAAVISLGRRNLEGLTTARFEKHYRDGPMGQPRFFLARLNGDAPVGMVALLPAQLRVVGQLVSGGIAGDFIVDAAHRGLGPVFKLQGALLETVRRGDAAFVYGVPNEAAEPVLRRIGYTDLGRLTRHVKVLRVQIAFERQLGRPLLGRLVSPIADPLLKLLSRELRSRTRPGLVVEQPPRFDERFSRLWATYCGRHRVCAERTVELLNWKYELDGNATTGALYAIVAIIEGDEARAYAVTQLRDSILHILELVSDGEAEAIDALLAAVIRRARSDGEAAVSLVHLGADETLQRRLRSFGFLPRPADVSLFVSVAPDSPHADALTDPGAWSFFLGDSDV